MPVNKTCKNVKIHKDLAPVKKNFNQYSFRPRLYDIQCVWTINGGIKYRLFNDSCVIDIRNYAVLDAPTNKT